MATFLEFWTAYFLAEAGCGIAIFAIFFIIVMIIGAFNWLKDQF